MKVLGRSLFLRIFLWFWMTMIVTGIALILTFMLQRGSVPDRWHDMLNDTACYSGSIAIAEMDVEEFRLRFLISINLAGKDISRRVFSMDRGR